MRIISGAAKGRKLFTPTRGKRDIRPTTDRAREALFSIIGLQVEGARVLDLFAGTGAIGCEALSRGASHVCFIEYDKRALELIRKNVSLIPETTSKVTILQHDLKQGLFPAYFSDSLKLPFDIIFADPPYQTNLSGKILLFLDKCPVLSKNVLVIIEETKDVQLLESLTTLQKDKTRRYGDTLFSFYRRAIEKKEYKTSRKRS